jgi:hypothetical protein
MILLDSANVCGLRFEVRTALTVTEEYLACDTHCLLEIYRRFSETSVNFYHTSRRHIAENGILHSSECV